MEHRRARGSPRPAARRHARRRSLLPWQSDSSLQVRALTPGCLCFGSVGSVWSVRIYVKAARAGRCRLTGLPLVLASLRYLVRLRWPPRRACIGGGVEPWRPGVGAGAFLKPRLDIGHAKAEPVAEPDTGRQGTTGGMAVVYGLQGKAGEFSQFGWGQQLLHARFLGNRHMPVPGIATPMQEAKKTDCPGLRCWITGPPHGSLSP